MMYLALTYDHRLLDGREAVTFLVKIKVRCIVAKTKSTWLTQAPGIHRGPCKDATGMMMCGQGTMTRVQIGRPVKHRSSCGLFEFKEARMV